LDDNQVLDKQSISVSSDWDGENDLSPDVQWTHPYLWEFVQLLPPDGHSLLDVGCGRGIVGALARIYRDYDRTVGVDVFEPYLKFVEQHRFYTEMRRLDLNSPLPFADKEFDVVTCLEVLEHLNKGASTHLIGEMQRVGRRIIFGTPDRFHQQPEFDGNLFQKHQSLWTPREFKRLGYNIVKARGRVNISVGSIHITSKHEYLAWRDA